MALFNKLFKSKEKKEEHAVIVHFEYLSDTLEALQNLESKLEKIVEENKVGEYDGHEIATDYSDGFLYLYGPNAEDLFKIIRLVLSETDFTKNATARLIFGELGSGAKEIEVEIDQ